MEGHLNQFRELLKNSLKQNCFIEKKEPNSSLSIIDTYNADEVYEELKFLLENLILFKKSSKKTDKTENSHIHIIDLPSEPNYTKLNSGLKNKLKSIQEKYLKKISKLLKIDPITITPMPFLHHTKVLLTKHCRKTSNFKSVNQRHPGTERIREDCNKYLREALTKASSNLLGKKRKIWHARAASENILC